MATKLDEMVTILKNIDEKLTTITRASGKLMPEVE